MQNHFATSVILRRYFTNIVHWGNSRKAELRGELWFAKPEDLNDPFEFRILTREPLDRRDAIEVALEYQSAAAPHLVRNTQDWEDWVKNVSESLLRAQLRGSRVEQCYFGESPVGVFCLCEKPNDVRMWSHYANSHSGVCIGLSSQRIQTESRIAKVEYCDSMPTVPLKNVLQGGPAAFRHFYARAVFGCTKMNGVVSTYLVQKSFQQTL